MSTESGTKLLKAMSKWLEERSDEAHNDYKTMLEIYKNDKIFDTSTQTLIEALALTSCRLSSSWLLSFFQEFIDEILDGRFDDAIEDRDEEEENYDDKT